jgi:hypothetical protein
LFEIPGSADGMSGFAGRGSRKIKKGAGRILVSFRQEVFHERRYLEFLQELQYKGRYQQ